VPSPAIAVVAALPFEELLPFEERLLPFDERLLPFEERLLLCELLLALLCGLAARLDPLLLRDRALVLFAFPFELAEFDFR